MRTRRHFLSTLIGIVVVAKLCAAAEPVNVPIAIKTLQAVRPKGAGTAEAAKAWRSLADADANKLSAILAGLDGANPLAANWIRSAVDTIAERELKATGTLPKAALEKFLLDTSHDPRGRRLAYEWLLKVDAAARERLLTKMLDDPSLEMRRDAVAEKMAAAETLAGMGDKKTQAAAAYLAAFRAARDVDQIKSLAAELKDLGQPVDLPAHYGFIMDWKLIGPFDNTDKKGLAAVYPPEQGFDSKASLEGKTGGVKWFNYSTTDELGVVDLNVAVGKHMGAVAYAYAEVTVPDARDAEIRLGSNNANKAWCNGKLLFANDSYHTGFEIDQFKGKIRLQAGKNQILVKICQNEQTEDWAQAWRFQLRVCDAIGTAILSADRPATPKKDETNTDKKAEM